jgi:CheY-like chemotaxis protein
VKKGFSILLVEDNPDDIFFVQRAFRTAHIEHPLFAVSNAREAIDFMSGKGTYADRSIYPLPKLVIVDLKMPGLSGMELIQWMRHDAYGKLVPIVVLSSSALSADVNATYALGANAYMVKPANPAALERLLRTIAEFWAAGEPPDLDWSKNPPSVRLDLPSR